MLDCSSSRDLGLFLFLLNSKGCSSKENMCTWFAFLLFCANFGKLMFLKKNYGTSLVYITSTIR